MSMRDELRETRFTRTLGAVFADVGLLLRQELELAKDELSCTLSEQARGAAYFAAAAVFCLVAILIFCASAIAMLIERGMRPSIACLVVAAAISLLALVSITVARSKSKAAPYRTMDNLRRDVEAAKEALK